MFTETEFVAIVNRHQAGVWRYLRLLGCEAALADDLTQDTFVRVIGALPAFRGESSARTWLLSIARRACADDIRRTQRRRGLLQRLQSLRPPDAASGLGYAEVDDLVRRLDPDRRDAFVLTQLIGLSYEEAADVCGCPVGTIRSRVARARVELLSATAEDEDQRRLRP